MYISGIISNIKVGDMWDDVVYTRFLWIKVSSSLEVQVFDGIMLDTELGVGDQVTILVALVEAHKLSLIKSSLVTGTFQNDTCIVRQFPWDRSMPNAMETYTNLDLYGDYALVETQFGEILIEPENLPIPIHEEDILTFPLDPSLHLIGVLKH